MYYHLSDHIYITQFRKEWIILDAKKDKYIICLEPISKLFSNIFENNKFLLNDNSHPGYSSPDLGYLQQLLDDHVIEKKEIPYPMYIDKKPASQGVSNVDWRLPLENKKIRLNINIFKAIITLIKVNFYMKFKGLYFTIQLLKDSRNRRLTYVIPSEQDLKTLVNVVNKACLIYPAKTKCLEWAMTFVLLALKRKWKCNLEIGVQNYPFFAHAWVECDGKVVMDDQNLRAGLSIILNQPFQRVST